MKTRASLVSNSSSASFVITWRCLNPEIENVKQSFEKLFNNFSEEEIQELCQTTNVLRSKAYRSVFSTSMFNDYSDFGPRAAQMLMALYLDNDFEIIDARIDSDN